MAKSPQSYLVQAIRKIWRWSPARRDCIKNAKECYVCGKAFKQQPKGLWKDRKKRKEWRKMYAPQADHVIGVGPAPKDWNGWDVYLKRMFGHKLLPICRVDHLAKNKRERAENAALRKKEKDEQA